MCGFIGANFQPSNPEQLLQTLAKRGPDAQNFIVSNENFLAHARLAILDLDEEANQPMCFDNLSILFNGEIYNYQQLQQNFDLLCITQSDTEVILRMYQKFGEKCLDYLDGIFAFVIYDTLEDKFFCARDRFGKKPFYYFYKNGKFVCSSLIQTIIKAIGYTPSMNTTALYEYLQFFTPLTPNTMYEDIFKLPASAYLIFHQGSIKIKKYFHIKRTKKIFDEPTAVELVERTLIHGVKKRLLSDAKIGALLSGGLDSSLVCALYAKHSDTPIETFSVGYEGYQNYDETIYAAQTAKHIGSKHHILHLSKDLFINNLESFLATLDEPHADSAAIALLALLEIPKQMDIKVLLSGEGSDELFFGYPTTPKLLEFHAFFSSLNANQKAFLLQNHKSLSNNSKEYEYIRRFLHNEPYYNGYGEIFNTTLKNQLLIKHKPTLIQSDISEPLDNMGMRDFQIWLGEALLTKIDKVGMSQSIEIRAPFLDKDLVQLAFSIDNGVRFGKTPKHLLKKIVTQYLPPKIVHRKKKAFNFPFNEWLHQHYDSSILNTILNANVHHQLFKIEFIKFLFESSKINNFRQHIWTLYIFSRWYEKNYL